MNETSGRVFSIAAENQPVAGCTTSKVLRQADAASILYFSLAAHTDIMPETYEYYKFLHVEQGILTVYTFDHGEWTVKAGESFVTPLGVPVGMRTELGCVYTEIEMRSDSDMNDVLKDGTVFALADLVPYQEGKIVNMDLARNEKMKFVMMSFDAGTGLSEHSAPGEALIFALDGEGVIGYEGVEHPIKAGENFKFAKGGKHFVRADKRFKMALLITLD